MTVRTHRFAGVKYEIDVEPFVGSCDNPRPKRGKDLPRIAMPGGLACGSSKKAKDDLHILLHECCHAENWSLSEDRVDAIAGDLAGLLWRLGYRRRRGKA